MNTERLVFFLTTLLLTIALVLTNLETLKVIQLANLLYTTENSTSVEKPLTYFNSSDVDEEIIVEILPTVETPRYWTDEMFDELISEGCNAVRSFYQPNLNHENGYELAYRSVKPVLLKNVRNTQYQRSIQFAG